MLHAAGSGNVSCSFEEPDICGYTAGSCWSNDVILYDIHGEPEINLLLCLHIFACFL